MELFNRQILARLLSNTDKGELAIKDASAKLIAIFNATPDAFIIINEKGIIELVNSATTAMFMYDEEELLGQNISILMPASLKQHHDGYLSSYLKTGKTNIIGTGRKLRAVKSNGQEFAMHLSVGQVENTSHMQFVGIISDLSEQEKYQTALAETQEKLAQATRLSAMGELAAGIAHEINQPLAAIASYAQASKHLINSLQNIDVKMITGPLDKIGEQAMRANEVINRLRNLVKKHTAQRERVDLNALIDETINLVKIDPRMFGHSIELDLIKDPLIELFVDPIQIQQVLLNLIRNAVDAMEQEEGMPLKIECRLISAKQIEVSVLDFGKGIDMDVSLNLFVPFFTTKETGMGMGLSVCQTIIHGHGGKIYYRRRQPKGTVFSFSLPIFIENQGCRKK
ncbi:MAG: two-component system sensor kinase FixL [Glaciecola sp.]|jgi:two-component system sensor kinase FixL